MRVSLVYFWQYHQTLRVHPSSKCLLSGKYVLGSPTQNTMILCCEAVPKLINVCNTLEKRKNVNLNIVTNNVYVRGPIQEK
jgi:hypothetical protein